MISKDVRDSIKENQHHLTNLVDSNNRAINVIIKHADHFAAVYAISSSTDDEIIYVGQTLDIVNRMNEHVSGNSSFGKKIKITKKEFKWYRIKYRRMADERQRRLFESYVIGTLKPKFNF